MFCFPFVSSLFPEKNYDYNLSDNHPNNHCHHPGRAVIVIRVTTPVTIINNILYTTWQQEEIDRDSSLGHRQTPTQHYYIHSGYILNCWYNHHK